MTTKTCDRCDHYTPSEYEEVYEGECRMTLDSNDGTPYDDRAYGWDYENYHAGVYVGPKFGCIHWMKKGKK